jgi:hypothetical protein
LGVLIETFQKVEDKMTDIFIEKWLSKKEQAEVWENDFVADKISISGVILPTMEQVQSVLENENVNNLVVWVQVWKSPAGKLRFGTPGWAILSNEEEKFIKWYWKKEFIEYVQTHSWKEIPDNLFYYLAQWQLVGIAEDNAYVSMNYWDADAMTTYFMNRDWIDTFSNKDYKFTYSDLEENFAKILRRNLQRELQEEMWENSESLTEIIEVLAPIKSTILSTIILPDKERAEYIAKRLNLPIDEKWRISWIYTRVNEKSAIITAKTDLDKFVEKSTDMTIKTIWELAEISENTAKNRESFDKYNEVYPTETSGDNWIEWIRNPSFAWVLKQTMTYLKQNAKK